MDLLDMEGAAPGEAAPLLESVVAVSQPFVGQWSRLVSTTNWEKGRIIVAWREAIAAEGSPATQHSDDAWGRLVGGVTGQHVGRLRRVYQRFGQLHAQFDGLYWSHFQAALDWDDAEMWLEGARQSAWSVNAMRDQRWQTLGKLAGDRPDAVTEDDKQPDEDADGQTHVPPLRTLTGQYEEVTGPRRDGPDFGDESASASGNGAGVELEWSQGAVESVEPLRPFERLPDLPDDMAEAFDAMKLSILRHKTDGWKDISAADVLLALDALKALATAPSDAAPF